MKVRLIKLAAGKHTIVLGEEKLNEEIAKIEVRGYRVTHVSISSMDGEVIAAINYE